MRSIRLVLEAQHDNIAVLQEKRRLREVPIVTCDPCEDIRTRSPRCIVQVHPRATHDVCAQMASLQSIDVTSARKYGRALKLKASVESQETH